MLAAFSSLKRNMAAKAQTTILAQKQLEEHTPRPQPYHAFADGAWRPAPPAASPNSAPDEEGSAAGASQHITSLRLITWNVDFMAPFPQARTAAALAHLGGLVADTPAPTAVVVLLQEMTQSPSSPPPDPQDPDDLGQIARAAWVREGFLLSDPTPEFWGCRYNSVTLVDRRLGVGRVSRLPLVSRYRREALLVDILLEAAAGRGAGDGDGGRVLRVCNVHLDSMAGDPPMRPIQWKGCAKHLQDSGDGVVAGIVAGDCNANQEYDHALPGENGFKDAYLELGGREDDARGFTWGPQSPGTRWPHKRMDKVCFCQNSSRGEVLRLKGLEKIGVGVRVEDEAVAKQLLEETSADYVTDHYGLMADFDLGNDWRFRAHG